MEDDMKKLFSPSISLMNRLSYLQKFVLIGLLFLLPIGLTLYLFISDLNEQIARVQLEKQGIVYNVDLRHFIEHVQEHRRLTNIASNGDNGFTQALIEIKKKIKQDIISIDRLEGKFGSEWLLKSQWPEVQREWQAIEDGSNIYGGPQETFFRHSDLVKKSLALVATSNGYTRLKLDAETNIFVGALMEELPALMETIGQARGLSAGAAAKKTISESERTQIIVLIGKFDFQYETIAKDLLELPIGDRGEFQTDLSHYEATIQMFREVIDQTLLKHADFSQLASNDLLLGTYAMDEGYKLYDAGIQMMDHKLKLKSDALQHKKYFVSLFTCLIWIVLVYLFVGFYLSVHNAIYKLMCAAAKMSNGDLTERVYLDSKDELQAVGNAYNKMAISLTKILNERDHQEEQIKFLAYHDALTGLPNRVLFQDRLGQAISLALRNHELVGVMFLDLDRFKTINDTFGHGIGDKLLQTVAIRLKSCLRASDTVTRMGGDEFMLILTGLKEVEQVIQLAKKLLSALSQPLKMESIELTVSGSLGISLYPENGQDIESLIRNADAAMYHAKSQGRNNYQFYDTRMNTLAIERLMMEEALRKALVHKELVLHYQPRQHLASGQITGMEALIRWQHPELGLLYPAAFLLLAEETGAIVEIGEWVLRTACLQIIAWQQAGLRPLSISVNISAVEFQRDDFYNNVARVLQETGLESSLLELELTESIVMRNASMTVTKLNQLRELGVKIAIDDFGTGSSSLSSLKHFSLDALKIDNSFIQNFSLDSKDTAITKTMIALARRLHLNVIAEGVETYEQLSFLRSRKCNEIQGFILSRPLPEKDITALLISRLGSKLEISQN
jgi:diguanylate cyclase (GGDEF)-like protein